MMQSLQQCARYEAYQDSGVEWLGEIPEGWELKKLKHVLNLVSVKESSLNSAKPYIGMENIQSWSGRFISSEIEAEGLASSFQQGDILFGKLRPYLAKVYLCEFEGICSSEFLVYRCSPNALSRFFQKTLLSANFIKRIDSSTYGSKMPRANSEFIGLQKIPVPPLIEQTAIANFLDQKTAEIDQAIALKTDLIERLKEYKQITIQHAVTRGLDPNAKMKASGVEWIGGIPEGWEITKVKFVTSKIGSGVTPSGGGTIYLETGIPLLRSQNVHFGKVDLDGVAYISEAMHQNMKNSIVLKNDVLLNITGGSIGRCHYSNFDFEMNVNQHVCIVRANAKINYLFLNLFLKSESGQGQIWQNQQGGGREGLNFAALKNFAIHLPPLAEQAAIVAHIEAISAKIDQATDQAQQQINTLTEYKTVLINAAVTGKIKVTDDSAQGTRHAQ